MKTQIYNETSHKNNIKMSKFKNWKRNKMRIIGTIESGIFFRSSANNWTTENQFLQFAENGYVCRNVKLNKGITEFKIADNSYSRINFGKSHKATVPNRYYTDLISGTNENAKIYRSEAGTADIFITTDKENNLSVFIR